MQNNKFNLADNVIDTSDLIGASSGNSVQNIR
jgi:hypothetical protein